MRIGLLNDKFYPKSGGVENSLYYIALTLMDMEETPIIIAEHINENLSYQENVYDMQIIRFPYKKLVRNILWEPVSYVRSTTIQLEDILKQVDAVWCRDTYVCRSVCKTGFKGPIIFIPPVLLNPFHKRELVSTPKNHKRKLALSLRYLIYFPQRAYIERNAFICSDKIVTFSENVASQIRNSYPFVEDKLSVVKPGVDNNKFIPKMPDPRVKKQYGIYSDGTAFLYVGRLSPEKDIDRLIEAFAMIAGSKDQLIIVGEGQQRPFLEHLSCELGVKKKIIFTGYQKDTVDYYALADFLILPTLYEGFGQVFLEALSSGVPCIGFDTELTATSEIIENGENGFIVYEHSSTSLGKILDRARNLTKSKYKRMSKSARETVMVKYRWENFVSEVLEKTKESLSK